MKGDRLLEEAMGAIKHEVDQVLDELDRIARGGDGELVPAGAGGLSPNRMETEPLLRGNEPMQVDGTPSGSLPDTITSAIGSNAAKKLVDEFDVNTVEHLFERMNQPTFHQMSLDASIKKVGLQELINLVKSNSPDGMIKCSDLKL